MGVAALSSPPGVLFQLVCLAFAAYHSVTWFALTPKAMPLVVRGEPVPAKAIVGMHYGAWALVSLIVLIAAGQLAQITFDPRETIETITAFIGATGNGDVPTGSTEYKTIFAVGLTLFVMTLVMNLVSIRLVRKYREVYE